MENILVRIGADISGLRDGLSKAEGHLRKSGMVFSGFGGQMSAAMSVAMAGFGAAAVNAQAEFGRSMSQMRVLTKAGGEEMKSLEKYAQQMGATGVHSVTEVSDAMLELVKSGMTPAEIKAGALQGALTLASAGSVGLGDAATIAANSLAQFKLSANDMPAVADAFAGAANASTASVSTLSEALRQVGPTAAQMGLSLNDSLGVLALFDQNALKGSDAGTSLKTMLMRLVPSTAEAADMMKKLGLDFTDAQGRIVPLGDVAAQLKAKLGGLSQEQQQLALSTIFGSDAIRGATILMNAGSDGLNEYVSATKDAGSAQELATANTEGMAGALLRLKNSSISIAQQFGSALEPTVTALAGAVSALGQWFTGLDDDTKQLIATVGLAVVAIGPMISVFGMLMGGVGTLISSFGGLMGALGRFGGAVSAAMAKGLTFTQSLTSAVASTTGWGRAIAGALKWFQALDGAMKATVIGAVIAAVSLAAHAFNNYAERAREASKGQMLIAAASAEAEQAIANERWEVERLSGIVADNTAKMDERKSALEMLKKIDTEFNRVLIDQKGNVIGLTEAHDQYIDRLRTEAKLNALKTKYADVIGQLADKEALAQKSGASWGQSIGNFIKSGGNAMSYASRQLSSTVNNLSENISNLERARDEIEKEMIALTPKALNASKPSGSTAPVGGLGMSGGGKPKSGSAVTQGADDAREAAQAQMELYEANVDAVDSYIELSLRQSEYASGLTQLPVKFAGVRSELAPLMTTSEALFMQFEQGAITIQEMQDGLVRLKDEALAPVNVAIEENGLKLSSWGSAIEGVKGALDGLSTGFGKLGDAIVATSEDGVTSLKEMGQAALKSARQAVAAFIQEGVAAVVRGTLISAGMAGPVAIPIAMAAGGLAAAGFNSLIGQLEVPAFADGGVITGPTLGLMGEYPGARSNPEFVGKLSDIKKYVGGGSAQPVVLSSYVRGNDVALVQERTNRARGRMF